MLHFKGKFEDVSKKLKQAQWLLVNAKQRSRDRGKAKEKVKKEKSKLQMWVSTLPSPYVNYWLLLFHSFLFHFFFRMVNKLTRSSGAKDQKNKALDQELEMLRGTYRNVTHEL